VIVRRHSELLGEALNRTIYLDMKAGDANSEEKKCYGLAQNNAFDDFLYRTLRWNWIFDTGGDIIT
jgi:hypothetical protein